MPDALLLLLGPVSLGLKRRYRQEGSHVVEHLSPL